MTDVLPDDARRVPKGYGRYRMAAAEELAHIHLHRSLIDQVATPQDFRALFG